MIPAHLLAKFPLRRGEKKISSCLYMGLTMVSFVFVVQELYKPRAECTDQGKKKNKVAKQ